MELDQMNDENNKVDPTQPAPLNAEQTMSELVSLRDRLDKYEGSHAALSARNDYHDRRYAELTVSHRRMQQLWSDHAQSMNALIEKNNEQREENERLHKRLAALQEDHNELSDSHERIKAKINPERT
jgi:chromosome segregation ATPase